MRSPVFCTTISDREFSEKEKNSSHKGDFSENVVFGVTGSESCVVAPEGVAAYFWMEVVTVVDGDDELFEGWVVEEVPASG